MNNKRWDVFDVAFLGTSLTWPPSSGDWVLTCETALQALVTRPVRFYQRGAGGATAASGYETRQAAINLKPRVIVLEYAMNDAYTPSGISVASFAATMNNFIDSIRVGSPSTVVALMTMNPAIGTGATTVPNLSQYYQTLRDISISKSTFLIDNTPLWGNPTSTQIPDGIHPIGSALRLITVPNVASRLATLIN